MADGTFLADLQYNGTVVPSTNILLIEQPDQIPKSRKIKLTDLLAPEATIRAAADTAEATARGLIGKTQIYDANVTGNAYAKDVGGAGSDVAATTALLSISKITAKAWMLQVQLDFATHTIVSGQAMKWTMHAASAGGGALVDDLLAALVAYGNGVAVPFGTWSWAYPGPIAESGFLMVAGANPATDLIFTPKDTYLWGAQTGVATPGQMNLRASGMVILP